MVYEILCYYGRVNIGNKYTSNIANEVKMFNLTASLCADQRSAILFVYHSKFT